MIAMHVAAPDADSAGGDAAPPRRRRFGRALRISAAVFVLLVIVMSWLTAHWFIWPHTTNPNKVDAVVVLGGGDGERLTRGLELMSHNVSSVLVLSTGTDWFVPASQPVHDLCDKKVPPPSFTLICVAARPDSTQGEAMTISQMARDHGWNSIALVTTDYHLTRSTRWFDRCYSGKLYPVAAPASASVVEIAHEWLGTVDQVLVHRHCG